MRILIITGGSSGERKISLASAKNVGQALKKLNYDVEFFDLAKGLELLSEKGRKADLVFPIIHGKEGESGELQEYLEKLKVKFIGSESKACRMGWDKFNFKKFCQKYSIQTPRWTRVNRNNFNKIRFKKPFIIKPSDSGSSLDVYLVKNNRDLEKIDLKNLFRRYREVMIEEYIQGIEVTVGILGKKVLPIIEIKPPDGELFDYKNKYNGKTKEIPHAPSLNENQREKVQKMAFLIHSLLGCRHYSRIDFIVNKNDIYALEINTIPGLTKGSLLPKAVKSNGLSFEQMVEKLASLAFEDFSN